MNLYNKEFQTTKNILGRDEKIHYICTGCILQYQSPE